MYLDNKYTRLYYAIIEKAQNVKISGKTERHHIIPKSLGGNNSAKNLVHLTIREHFIVHKLLTKMTTHDDLSNMWMALWCMSNSRNYRMSSREFEVVKEHAMVVMYDRWGEGEYREKQMNIRRSREFRSKLSDVRKESCGTEEFRQWATKLHSKMWKVYHIVHTKGAWVVIENIKKFCDDNELSQGNMGEVSRGRRKQHKGWLCIKLDDVGGDIVMPFVEKDRAPHSDETKKKIGDIQRGKKRKPHSEETRKKLKTAAVLREQRKRLNVISSS